MGGLLSPLLSNIALSVLDDHFMRAWEEMGDSYGRARRRRRGEATYRLVRYADDWVLLVAGTEAHAEALHDEAAAVLAPMGLALSETKTRIVHVDEGFTFLGFRIRRDRKKGTNKRYVYTYPSKEALASIKRKVRTITNQGTNQPLGHLLRQLNPALRGWTNYFCHGVSKQTFAYLSHFTWWRVVKWLRRKHRRTSWKKLRQRYPVGASGSWPTDGDLEMFNPAKVTVTRYRYRGNIPTPWQQTTETRGEPDARTTCTSGSEARTGETHQAKA